MPRQVEAVSNASWFINRSVAFLERAGRDSAVPAPGQLQAGPAVPEVGVEAQGIVEAGGTDSAEVSRRDPEADEDAMLSAVAAGLAAEDSSDHSSSDDGRAILDHPGLAAASGFEDQGAAQGNGPKGRGKAKGGRTVVLGGLGVQVARPLRDPPWLVAWRERKAREEAAERVHQSMAGVYQAGALGQFRRW